MLAGGKILGFLTIQLNFVPNNHLIILKPLPIE